MSQRLTHRTSMLSLGSARPDTTMASRPRLSRNCSNCICSPGLLSRQNRRSSIMARRVSLRRNSVSFSRTNTRNNSFIGEECASVQSKELNTSKRLESLRNEMKLEDLSIYIVPSEDEHQSEYVNLKDQRRGFISGFQGSAGTAIITRDLLDMNETPDGLSILHTDGRYYLQASNELDFNWKLLKTDWKEWLKKQAVQMFKDTGLKIKIGINPKLISFDNYLKLKGLFVNEKEIEIVPVQNDLIDKIWKSYEPEILKKPSQLIDLDLKFTGLTIKEKLELVKNHLTEKYDNSNLIISGLDEIAWLLNLRGNDIPYNPVFYSYFVLNENPVLYVDLENHQDNLIIKKKLKDSNIEIKRYDEFYNDLLNLNGKYLVPSYSNWAIVNNLTNYQIIESPISLLKSIKNSTEIENFKVAHFKDGIASIKFFSWLENELINKDEFLTEYEVCARQKFFRAEQENFVDLSFETISSTGPNSAIIHYAPNELNSAIIDPAKIYLNDSGAQFLEGTTDITRTFHFTEPTMEEKINYTLVLKGNLALENLQFPEKTTNGYCIDVIARQFLWSNGLDYNHGTSHGIGSFLNVHEGPIGISYNRPNYIKYPLNVGNVLSNEPGYYKENDYGIRIENVMMVIKSEIDGFLKFENLTKVPYCKNLININLLNIDEIEKINKYHAKIWTEFKETLKVDKISYNWLRKECSPL